MSGIDFTRKDKKISKRLITIIVIILVILSFTALAKYGGISITGLSVLNPFSDQEDNSGKISSGSSKTSSSDLQSKNIDIKADIQLQDYSIPISASSIEIQAAQII